MGGRHVFFAKIELPRFRFSHGPCIDSAKIHWLGSLHFQKFIGISSQPKEVMQNAPNSSKYFCTQV